jgi:predicted lipid-binding transport protein (Tim44 family)
VAAPAGTPYGGDMRALLLGLVGLVVAIFVISILIKVFFFGLVLVLVAGVTFVAFRFSRRSRDNSPG